MSFDIQLNENRFTLIGLPCEDWFNERRLYLGDEILHKAQSIDFGPQTDTRYQMMSSIVPD